MLINEKRTNEKSFELNVLNLITWNHFGMRNNANNIDAPFMLMKILEIVSAAKSI